MSEAFKESPVGSSVDGDAPPDFSRIFGHAVGEGERNILRSISKNDTDKITPIVERIGNMLGADNNTVERVIAAVKRMKKGNKKEKIVAGWYAEADRIPTRQIASALRYFGTLSKDEDEYAMYHTAYKLGVKVAPRRADAYSLNRLPHTKALLNDKGIYEVFMRRLQVFLNGAPGKSPKMKAKNALKRAEKEVGGCVVDWVEVDKNW